MTENLLKTVKRGKELKPPIVLIYGPPGVGKSTLASTTKTPIFLDLEDRLSHIDCVKTPLIESTEQFMDWLRALRNVGKPVEVLHKTVVIDTIDALQDVIHNDICKEVGAKEISDFSNRALAYGSGYKRAAVVWDNIISMLRGLRDINQMTVIMLAHSKISRFEDPMHAAFDRYELDMHQSAVGKLTDAPDIIGFMNYEAYTKEEQEGFRSRTKAVGEGRRVIYFSPRPYFIAKNSYHLPDKMDVTNWGDISQLILKDLKSEKGHEQGWELAIAKKGMGDGGVRPAVKKIESA